MNEADRPVSGEAGNPKPFFKEFESMVEKWRKEHPEGGGRALPSVGTLVSMLQTVAAASGDEKLLEVIKQKREEYYRRQK